MPVFVGGVGGGANDPAYNDQADATAVPSHSSAGVSATTAGNRHDTSKADASTTEVILTFSSS